MHMTSTPRESTGADNKVGAVLVVGGGIAGIQAALDLAESGFFVHLVEKKPAIGGVMPQLDKTFPTNDCSMCTLAPKLVEAGRHLNINILAPARVEAVEGELGDFRVTVCQEPRYVNTERCIACGICAEKCPKIVPDEFNQGLSFRRAAYVQYPQAVPLKYAIDKENCLFFTRKGKCRACEKFCPAEAIDFAQEDLFQELRVGAVILATGFQLLDARVRPEYGYGRYPNVVTALEFERFLSTTGPTNAHVKRPSEGADPQKIAWIQCAGSRDAANGRDYCSSVCCMSATKQALIAREHDSRIEPTIFFMDLRAHGKGFERYYQNARAHQQIRYIRSMVSRVTQNPSTHNLELSYVDEIEGIRTEEFDLVVLSPGLGVHPDNLELAGKMGVALTPNSFVQTSCFAPVNTSRGGIFACGTFTGPKDIPDSVIEGSAAAAAAARVLAPSRGSLARTKEFPREREVREEAPRVGVFICHCGLNIGGVADIPALVEAARHLPDVVYISDSLFTCSQDSQNQIAELIKEHNLNRVVVAACSPHTHAPLFQNMLRESGLNKYLFEMANIRNQCTWVHQGEPEAATEKCKDLIRMGVAKGRLLEPLEYLTVPLTKTALVIGGGMAGMTSALSLADQGFDVHLVERLDRLGGNARKLDTTWRGTPVPAFVQGFTDRVEKHSRITVHYQAVVTEVSGTTGNFRSTLSTGLMIDHGVVIIAVGAEPLRPEGMYLYKRHPNVLLSLDLDRELARGSARVQNANGVAFMQCVGSRIPERPYCMRLCCSHSVENAIRLKEMNPDMRVYILYRDIRTYGEREALYTEARQKGVLFLRYAVDEPPEVTYSGEVIHIRVMDQSLRLPVTLTVDLLTLSSAIVPHQNAPLAELYKVPLNAEGFFTEAHLKIKPVEASTEGIFMAGLCHYPKPIQESLAEALAAASRAATIMSKDSLMLESTVSRPIDENCDGCAFCVDACPFKAITLLEYMKDGMVKKTVEVEEVLCKGCGSCMATCPKRGIVVAGFTLDQLGAQVDAALEVAY
jgi:heterodisulfide reductase subunit A